MSYPFGLSNFIRDNLDKSNDDLFFLVMDKFAGEYPDEVIRETLRYEWLFHQTDKADNE